MWIWGVGDAVWVAENRRECFKISVDGACWAGVISWMDNIFYGRDFTPLLNEAAAATANSKAVVFTQWVSNPQDYGVLTTDRDDNPLS